MPPERKELFPPEIIEEHANDIAIIAAMKASRLVLRYWPNLANPDFDPSLTLSITSEKAGQSNYATIADEKSENLIRGLILNEPLLKNHTIRGEETDDINTDSPYRWEIDPIDGTMSFRNGMPEFGISIGVLKDNQPLIGVIALPAYGQLITARKGNGAQLLAFDGREIAHLTEREKPEIPFGNSFIGFDMGYKKRGEQLTDYAAKIADKVGYVVTYASSAYTNFSIATGSIAGYIHNTPTIFDIAAAAAILPEVGGRVTDMKGNPIDWNAPDRSYLAARDLQTHRKILKIIT